MITPDEHAMIAALEKERNHFSKEAVKAARRVWSDHARCKGCGEPLELPDFDVWRDSDGNKYSVWVDVRIKLEQRALPDEN